MIIKLRLNRAEHLLYIFIRLLHRSKNGKFMITCKKAQKSKCFRSGCCFNRLHFTVFDWNVIRWLFICDDCSYLGIKRILKKSVFSDISLWGGIKDKILRPKLSFAKLFVRQKRLEMWMHRGMKIAVKRNIKIDWYFDMIKVFFEYGMTFELDTVLVLTLGSV